MKHSYHTRIEWYAGGLHDDHIPFLSPPNCIRLIGARPQATNPSLVLQLTSALANEEPALCFMHC